MNGHRRHSAQLSFAATFAVAFIAGLMPAPALGQLVRSVAGAAPADIQATVDQFRTDLGTLNANVVGSFGSGRREINWDGVPDSFSAPNNLPANFFNVNSPRGVVFSTPGTGFQTSANAVNPTSTPIEFGNIDPSYPGIFEAFSPQRLFTPLGSNILDVTFFVAGSSTAATVKGFGAVFTDVDLANTSSVQFFDTLSNSLGVFVVPPVAGSTETVSFLGVSFATPTVARVRIVSGSAALAPGVLDGAADLVVMDDFIYSEPVAVSTAVTLRTLSVARSGRDLLVRWRTASESDILGYNVFREANGRRIRLNSSLIRSKGALGSASYSFRARARRVALTSRYWLQVVRADGSRSWLGSAKVRPS